MRDLGNFGDIQDFNAGITQCLTKDQPRVICDRCLKGIMISRIDECGLDPKARHRIAE